MIRHQPGVSDGLEDPLMRMDPLIAPPHITWAPCAMRGAQRGGPWRLDGGVWGMCPPRAIEQKTNSWSNCSIGKELEASQGSH